jgi:hypothetical protein
MRNRLAAGMHIGALLEANLIATRHNHTTHSELLWKP